jgi:hypothetical protein
MNAMKKEIARLSNSLIDEKKKEPKRGEFENHTKGFGSSYMKKFGFADGKGLGMRTMCGSRTGGWSLPCVMSD